jgi:hypothetical protein
MIDPDRLDAVRYVQETAPLVDLALTPEQVERVAAALAVAVRIGAPALAVELPPETEPAPVFTP